MLREASQHLPGEAEGIDNAMALARHIPAADVKDLQQLAGHLQESWFITKFRKLFARDEMNDDLLIVPARYNGTEDNSEYEEILPTSPP